MPLSNHLPVQTTEPVISRISPVTLTVMLLFIVVMQVDKRIGLC